MYKFFVGVDVSKEWIDASWTDGSNSNYVGQFTNSIKGFKKLLAHLKKETLLDIMEWFICFENTGTYSKLLLQWLCSQGISCREENSLKISKEAGLRRGKSDKMDSATICKYAFKNRHEISPTHLPSPAIEQIKKLLSRREFLVRHRSALKTSLKEQKAEYSPELFIKLDHDNTLLIDQFNEGISLVEQQIEKIIQSENELKKNNSLVQSVTGIGPIITWYMIAYSGNFKNFANSRKFSSYGGTAPFPNSSGKSKKGKDHVSHFANKQIKALLSNGAQAAIQNDVEIKFYYQRKRDEGKEDGVVINAIKNKLIARAFAVVKRGTPFIKLHNYA